MRPLFSVVLFLCCAVALADPDVAVAQEEAPAPYYSASAGLFQYELDGRGYGAMVALRAGSAVSSVLLLEGGLVAARPEQDAGTSTVLIPEAQVQLSLPFTSVTPYMGLGGGGFLDLKGSDAGGTDLALTISAALGFRAWLGDRFGAVLEFRGRGIGTDFRRTSAEYSIGGVMRR